MNSRRLESRILEQLEKLAAEAALEGVVRRRPARGPDFLVEIRGQGRRPVRVVIEVRANPRSASIQEAADQALAWAKKLGAIAAVGIPRLGSGLKQILRERAVGYVSLDGHIYLKGPGVLIDRQVPSAANKPSWVQESSLFADKSSLLLRYLFEHPSAPLRVRQMAAELGISIGLVSRLASKLRDEGYLVDEGRDSRLVSREALLEDWRELYRRRARRQREQRMYLHARDVGAVMERLAAAAPDVESLKWGLSYHAGASLVAPYAFFSEVHVLLGGGQWDDAMARFSRRLGLEQAKAEANVVLVQPYYRHSWHYGLREIEGLPVVSDVQLYLDLNVYARRGAEQAERIRERILEAGRGEPRS